jgi:hypothetical protein
MTHIYLKSDQLVSTNAFASKKKKKWTYSRAEEGFSFCSYNATRTGKKPRKEKYLLISKQNKARQKINTQLN